MATRRNEVDSLTAVEVEAPVQASEPTVQVFIPLAEAEGDVKVDQTENVTINGETTVIKRGQYVSVKIPVFMQLRNKYPNL